jgi:hypothetical protein
MLTPVQDVSHSATRPLARGGRWAALGVHGNNAKGARVLRRFGRTPSDGVKNGDFWDRDGERRDFLRVARARGAPFTS